MTSASGNSSAMSMALGHSERGMHVPGVVKDAPKATAGSQVEHPATLSSVLGGEHLMDGANVILSAKEKLQHPVLELGALGGGVRRGGKGRGEEGSRGSPPRQRGACSAG